MRKKKTKGFLLIIFILLGFHFFISDVKADVNCVVHHFTSNKDNYYNDEEILLNLSYTLFYDSGDYAFIQVHVFNETNDIVWESAEYDQEGTFEQIIIAKIQDFNHPFINDSSKFTIKLYFDYYDIGGGGYLYLEDPWILEILSVKRNVSCELIDFRNEIELPQDLNFKARFFLASNNTNLSNYLVSCIIISNELTLYDNEFMTNSTGLIGLFISGNEDLLLGKNELIFRLNGTGLISDYENTYTIFAYNSIQNVKNSDEDSSLKEMEQVQSYIIYLISILGISSLISIYIINKYIKNREHKLADLTFKY
ncbi:MAG: hypothetical protein ACFFAO_12240 [Candidatus Hermodarchaeota archaeon]